jgi:phosphatidylserine decarboxylase precursor
MFRPSARFNPKFWKSNSHLHWSNPLRRWVYVKFGVGFVAALAATPLVSYTWTAMLPEDRQPPETFANFPLQVVFEMAPLNLLSRTIGDVASAEVVPARLHHRAIRFIAWLYGIDLSEFPPVETFRTAQHFFSRRFADVTKSRPIDESALELVSPCDAEILQCGEVDVTGSNNNKPTILQVKGYSYPVEGLFRMTLPNDLDSPFDQLNAIKSSIISNNNKQQSDEQQKQQEDENENVRMYFVFHLRPGDYHRVHSPRDTKVLKTLYVPGLLYPTTHTAMRWLPNLILSNERILSFGYSTSTSTSTAASNSNEEQEQKQQQEKKKLTAMALVGATCVGKITMCFDERILTNLADPPEAAITREYKNAAPLIKKGDEFGYFNWGSCVVLIADVSRKSLKTGGLKVKPGDEVRMGQRLI